MRRGTVAAPGALLTAGCFVALSLTLLAFLPFQTHWAARTKLYLQPGFWPAVAIAAMVLFSAGHLLRTALCRPSPGTLRELGVWVRALEFVVWFLVYVLLVPLAGYLASTLAFSCALAWRAGYRTRTWMAIAALFGFAVVVVFKSILGVNIPAGQIYDLLPPGGFRSFVMTHL